MTLERTHPAAAALTASSGLAALRWPRLAGCGLAVVVFLLLRHPAPPSRHFAHRFQKGILCTQTNTQHPKFLLTSSLPCFSYKLRTLQEHRTAAATTTTTTTTTHTAFNLEIQFPPKFVSVFPFKDMQSLYDMTYFEM